MVYLLKFVIFHGCVKEPDGISTINHRIHLLRTANGHSYPLCLRELRQCFGSYPYSRFNGSQLGSARAANWVSTWYKCIYDDICIWYDMWYVHCMRCLYTCFLHCLTIFACLILHFENRGEVRKKTCHGRNLGGDYQSTDNFSRAEVDALAGQSGGLFWWWQRWWRQGWILGAEQLNFFQIFRVSWWFRWCWGQCILMYFFGGLPDDPRTMWVFLAQLCWNRAQAVLGYPYVSIPNLSL